MTLKQIGQEGLERLGQSWIERSVQDVHRNSHSDIMSFIAIPFGNVLVLTMVFQPTLGQITKAKCISMIDFFSQDECRSQECQDVDNGLKIGLFLSAACRTSGHPMSRDISSNVYTGTSSHV